MNGPSHIARLPSLRAMFGEHMLRNHESAAQAQRRHEDGEWVISVPAPPGVQWRVDPEEARVRRGGRARPRRLSAYARRHSQRLKRTACLRLRVQPPAVWFGADLDADMPFGRPDTPVRESLTGTATGPGRHFWRGDDRGRAAALRCARGRRRTA